MTGTQELDAIVVGAGQGGLAASYYLEQAGVEHVVLERSRIGESWLSQRWDSFRLNTPNWSNALPGLEPEGDSGDFESHLALVEYFRRYVDKYQLPVLEGVSVASVERDADGSFLVESGRGSYRSKILIVASGNQNHPRLPAIATKAPTEVESIHTAEYQNPHQLRDGAVLVVGSGQSGCQIVEDLLEAGRKVFLCTSKVGRAPRRYRGRDLLEWYRDAKLGELRVEDLEDPALQYSAQPQISGTKGGHSISLQQLARDGTILLGRLEDIDGTTVRLDGSLPEHVAFADDVSAKLKKGIDKYIETHGLEADPPSPDPVETIEIDPTALDAPRELDLIAEGIRTIIWSTGFGGNFDWLSLPVFDDHGRPVHRRGVAEIEGVYFVGFSWLSKRKSGIVYGVGEDAEYVVRQAAAQIGAS